MTADTAGEPKADATAEAASANAHGQEARLPGVRGFAVLGHAAGELAVWAMAVSGQRGWAAVDYGDVAPDRARALLSVIERRALIGVDRDADLAGVHSLADAAGITVPSQVQATWLDVLSLFEDSAATRAEIADTGEDLSYKRSLPRLGVDVDRALTDLRLIPPQPDSAAARQALAVCVLTRAAIAVWDDTETARIRRRRLRKLGGPHARPVPDRWLVALTGAQTTTFTL